MLSHFSVSLLRAGSLSPLTLHIHNSILSAEVKQNRHLFLFFFCLTNGAKYAWVSHHLTSTSHVYIRTYHLSPTLSPPNTTSSHNNPLYPCNLVSPLTHYTFFIHLFLLPKYLYTHDSHSQCSAGQSLWSKH